MRVAAVDHTAAMVKQQLAACVLLTGLAWDPWPLDILSTFRSGLPPQLGISLMNTMEVCLLACLNSSQLDNKD